MKPTLLASLKHYKIEKWLTDLGGLTGRTHRGHRLVSGVSPPYFYRQGVSPNLKFTNVARPTGQKELIFLSASLVLGLKVDRVGVFSWVLGVYIF